jgi:predicted hydrolase (HD superfamily)
MAAEHSRERALAVLEEWTKGESLRKHGLAVSVCTEAYGVIEAARLGLSGDEAAEFVALYACAGLLHDMDYERHPTQEEHPFVGVTALRAEGWPEPILHAILVHADYSGVAAESHLDKALFACDELAGFLTACALIKPSKSIHEVEAASVKKKLKDKAFARGVNRDDIYKGAEELGVPLDEHIAFCIAALRGVAPELGLNGSSAVAAP